MILSSNRPANHHRVQDAGDGRSAAQSTIRAAHDPCGAWSAWPGRDRRATLLPPEPVLAYPAVLPRVDELELCATDGPGVHTGAALGRERGMRNGSITGTNLQLPKLTPGRSNRQKSR